MTLNSMHLNLVIEDESTILGASLHLGLTITHQNFQFLCILEYTHYLQLPAWPNNEEIPRCLVSNIRLHFQEMVTSCNQSNNVIEEQFVSLMPRHTHHLRKLWKVLLRCLTGHFCSHFGPGRHLLLGNQTFRVNM